MTVVGGRTTLDLAVERLAAELDRWHVPGLELAVVRDGEVLFAGGLGVRGVDDPTHVGSRTLFRHGSCGKAYTSLAAAVLAHEGVLDLDAPVRRYVPELRLPDMTIADRITTRDLLAHRSGIGRHDFTWIANPAWSADELLARLEHLPLAGDLRAQFVYSNLGYAVAGIGMERAAGASWSDVLHSRVLDPSGMTRSWIDLQRTLDDDHATPHLERDGKPVVTGWRPISGAAPAGAVMTCADDAARWLLVHTGDDCLPASVVTATHHLQTPTPAGMSPFPELRLYGYGMGWLVATWRGRPMVSHTGGIDGFTTHTLVLTDQRIGVTISVNQHLSSLAMAGCLDIADVLLGETAETPWFDVLRGDESGDDVAPAQRTPAESLRSRSPVHPLASYAGVYAHPGYGEVRVAVEDDALSVRIGELDCTAKHRQLDTWDVHYDALDVDLPLVFETDAEGAVRRVVAEFDGEQPVTYVRSSVEE